MNHSIETFIAKSAAIAFNKIAGYEIDDEDYDDSDLELDRRSIINDELEDITENDPNSRVLRHYWKSRVDTPYDNKELHKKIRTDLLNQTGAGAPIGTEDAYYKQPDRHFSARFKIEQNKGLGSQYVLNRNSIELSPLDRHNIVALGHEAGHAQDPYLEDILHKHDPWSRGVDSNMINAELRASENGRRMLRDGYGVSDDIAKGTYNGLPTYVSAAFPRSNPDSDYIRRLPDPLFRHNPKAGLDLWSPETRNAIQNFNNSMGWTPESIAKDFTKSIVSSDPITRKLEHQRAYDRSTHIDMDAFDSDESAYNAFMPRIPDAKPSGISINGKPIPNNWQHVRSTSVYDE